MNKYQREIKPGVWVDVYDVLNAWKVTNPALQHLLKKALQPGERGHKDLETDLKDIIASAQRAYELEFPVVDCELRQAIGKAYRANGEDEIKKEPLLAIQHTYDAYRDMANLFCRVNAEDTEIGKFALMAIAKALGEQP